MKISVELSVEQIEMIMCVLSNHMSELTDDDGNLLKNNERGAKYYDSVRDTYMTFYPLQSQF